MKVELASPGGAAQEVVSTPSIAALVGWSSASADALARSGGGVALGGASGFTASSSIHTLPLPPLPAVIANSIAATWLMSPPPIGPHAKLI